MGIWVWELMNSSVTNGFMGVVKLIVDVQCSRDGICGPIIVGNLRPTQIKA